jgi:hypothetical protein
MMGCNTVIILYAAMCDTATNCLYLLLVIVFSATVQGPQTKLLNESTIFLQPDQTGRTKKKLDLKTMLHKLHFSNYFYTGSAHLLLPCHFILMVFTAFDILYYSEPQAQL